MKIEFVIVSLLFILNPVIAVPILLIGIYNKRRYSQVYLAIFLGIVSMYYYPQGDQYRYLEDFMEYRNAVFSQLFNFDAIITIRNFNLITLTLFAASKLPFMTLELYRMLLVTLGSIIIFDLFDNIIMQIEPSPSPRVRFKLFVIVLLSIPVYYISQGFRSGLGAVFLSLGIYKLLNNYKSGYIWMLISCLIHYSYLPLSIIYIISSKLKWRLNNKNFIIALLFIISLLYLIIILTYNRFPFITMMLDIYIYGSYGSEFIWNAYRLKEVLLINGIPVFLLYLLFISSKKDTNFRFTNILYVNLILLIVSLHFQAIFQRLGIVSILLLAIYAVRYYRYTHILKNYKAIVLSLCISVTFPFFMHRYCYYHSNIETMFVSPLPIILKNTYDISEVNCLLDENGVLKQQYLK